jgi:hypothetical protein
MLLFSSCRSQGATSLFFDRPNGLKAKRTGHGLYCFRIINGSFPFNMRWRVRREKRAMRVSEDYFDWYPKFLQSIDLAKVVSGASAEFLRIDPSQILLAGELMK